MYCITKWCKSITESGKDECTGRLNRMKCEMMERFGYIPELFDFRLLDDDSIVYAYGKCTSNSSFAPLDRYMYVYGCSDIQYKNKETGRYESL